jgi:hypothetical protein
MATLKELIAADDTRPEALARYLDGLTHEQRLAEVLELNGKEQERLYDRVAGAAPIGIDFFVPPSVPPMTEVIHHGRNNLPMFTRFQKRFCRPEPGAGVLCGYNHQTMSWITGPGYFVVHPVEAEQRVVIDYTDLPAGKPESWPKIMPNSRMFSRLVYYQMKDYMWRVSQHVSIGRACKNGKWMPNWFVLVREDRA